MQKSSNFYLILLLINIAIFLMLYNSLLLKIKQEYGNYGYLNKGYAMLYERNFDVKYTDEWQEIISDILNNNDSLKLDTINKINIRIGMAYNDYVFNFSLYLNVSKSVGKAIEQQLLNNDIQYQTHTNDNFFIVNNYFVHIENDYKTIIVSKSITGKYHYKRFYYDIYTDDLTKYIYKLNDKYRVSIRNKTNLSILIIIIILFIINFIFIKILKKECK